MKDFDWTQFTRKIAIKTDVQSVYNAWANPEIITTWFLGKADYEDANGKEKDTSVLNQKGDVYHWMWHIYDIRESGKIIEANGKDLFSFTFAGDCIVEIKLEQIEDYTQLSLVQKEIPTSDDAKEGIRLGCHTGWSFFLVNLKSVLEGGLDLRNKEERFRGINN